jgi:hypothetical protein
MKELLYGDSSHELFLNYPQKWDAANISGVTVGIKDKSGTELLAAQACTLTTALINGDVTAKAMSIVVDGLSGSIRLGARYRLQETTAADVEDNEDVVVRSTTVSGSDYTLNLEEELEYDHSDDTNVTGCYCYYAADLSDTDTFTEGLEVVLTWTPAGTDDHAWTEIARLSGARAGVSNLWDELRTIAPSVSELLTDRSSEELKKLESLLRRSFESQFKTRQLDINRVVDQDLLHEGALIHAQVSILRTAGERYEDELKETKTAWSEWFNELCKSPIWVDVDHDEIEDDEEVDTHNFEVMQRYI